MSKYTYYTEPFELEGRPRRFLEAFEAILKHSNYGLALDTYTRTATKCGRCAATCPVYENTGEARDIPCFRSEMLLSIYRRYFTFTGMMKARLLPSFELTDEHIDEMAEAAYRCTACRRCFMSCPMGIDHGLMTHLMRWILAEIGIVPKALAVATREQLEGKTGNTSGIPAAAMKDTCEFLEEEFEDDYNVQVKFPIDARGSEYIFFPAVSDYLLEPDTLMGNAAVMHLTGGSWTIGTGNFDGINYGLFYSDRHLCRIVRREVEEMKRLGAKKILIGECGHASRSAKQFIPIFCGGKDAPEVVNFMEYTYDAWKKGLFEMIPNSIKKRVTYHDPCNIARSGWITEQPREILEYICADFVDMVPNREHNYCCGGGGGTVSVDEIRAFRTGPGGKRKAQQVRETGAEIVVAPCANCKKQMREVLDDNDLEDVEVAGLHDLILKSVDLGGGKSPADDEEE
jgi:Fe-S oxidoreductase